MEQANYIKAIVTAVLTIISSLLGVLAIPVVMLVGSNIVDYATGLMASPYRDEDINSYKSIRGIFKKIGMWLLVLVGAMVDEVLMYTSMSIGKEMPLKFVIACAVALWLICNEIISILENVQDMGVNIPPFLQPLVKHIRSQVEEQAEEMERAAGITESEEGDNDNED